MDEDCYDAVIDGCTFEMEAEIEVFEGQKWSITNCTFNDKVKISVVSLKSVEEARTRLQEIEADLVK